MHVLWWLSSAASLFVVLACGITLVRSTRRDDSLTPRQRHRWVIGIVVVLAVVGAGFLTLDVIRGA